MGAKMCGGGEWCGLYWGAGGGAAVVGGLYGGSSGFRLEYRVWGEGWALGYNSMKFEIFLIFPES